MATALARSVVPVQLGPVSRLRRPCESENRYYRSAACSFAGELEWHLWQGRLRNEQAADQSFTEAPCHCPASSTSAVDVNGHFTKQN